MKESMRTQVARSMEIPALAILLTGERFPARWVWPYAARIASAVAVGILTVAFELYEDDDPSTQDGNDLTEYEPGDEGDLSVFEYILLEILRRDVYDMYLLPKEA